MREILFRGQRIDNGEWVEGGYQPETTITYWDGTKETYGVAITYKTEDGFLEDADVIPETIGQYTGLTDKNGKRIFEGDIWDCQGYKGVIKWNDDDCAFEATYTVGGIEYANAVNSKRAKSAKVIGNIHDNPELLKGENNV